MHIFIVFYMEMFVHVFVPSYPRNKRNMSMPMPGLCVNVYHNKIAKGCKVNYAKPNLSVAISFHFRTQANIRRTKNREKKGRRKIRHRECRCALAHSPAFIRNYILCMQSYNQKHSDFVQFFFRIIFNEVWNVFRDMLSRSYQ